MLTVRLTLFEMLISKEEHRYATVAAREHGKKLSSRDKVLGSTLRGKVIHIFVRA